jgi:cell division topological specificity factor MinE
MASLLVALRNKLFGSKVVSKSKAKSRLHFVLVQDRTGLTNEEMNRFKRELVSVIETYFVIDKQGFDVAYEREGNSTTLLINSPVVVRRQDAPDKRVGATKRLRKGKKRIRPHMNTVPDSTPPAPETPPEPSMAV